MRVDDRCQAHRCAGGGVRSTRITGTELAARNRSARFPAARCDASLQGPRPSSTGTARAAAVAETPRCMHLLLDRLPVLIILSTLHALNATKEPAWSDAVSASEACSRCCCPMVTSCGPTGCGESLWQDGVRVLTRTMQRASAALGETTSQVRRRLRSVGRRVLIIGRQARSPETRTAPARISAWARSRLGASSRWTSS